MFNPNKGLSNSYFTAAGSISTDKGSASVNGSSIKSCLKLDSKGSIKFTTKTDGAKLTIYVKGKSSGSTVLVNGSKKFSNIGTSVEAKVITLGNAGTYTLTKGTNETYIFYVIVEENGGSSSSQGSSSTSSKSSNVYNASASNSNYFTVSGSVTDKGSTTYNGTKLTKVLKMDSKGSIKFKTSNSNAKLTVVCKAKSSGAALKVNGSNKLTDIGTSVVTKTMTLGSAGTYEITKGSGECYIYYVIVEE